MIEVAVDNDVLLKAAIYGLSTSFWPDLSAIGILGAAKWVCAGALDHLHLSTRDLAAVDEELSDIFDAATVLEPSDSEVQLALKMEVLAQQRGFSLDGGESQLSAMVIERSLAFLETGDKRAIVSLERLIDELGCVVGLIDKLRCLEQVVLRAICEEDSFPLVAGAICAEPGADVALGVCFSCASGGARRDSVIAGLGSYISDTRNRAPRVLAAA